MAAISTLVPLGTPAPDFSLPAIDGRVVARDDFAAAPALLVAFLCNHCPYVRHVEQAFAELVGEFPDLAVVGICSNSPAVAPADDTDGLRAQVTRTGWAFPYLVDLDQSVGRAYQAACTPDFFLYDAHRELAYRGAMDDSTPGNGKPVTGGLLRHAIDLVLAGRTVPEPHRPSMGCSIKWA
ncbi:thioredoxin family protein [Kitasatospora sp. NPDC085879]|uniref:thioredoxin family protein n=1 Tax=Kitasatospora sp. NPDC085879 TaxID=3154769 RepID=UPI003446457B